MQYTKLFSPKMKVGSICVPQTIQY